MVTTLKQLGKLPHRVDVRTLSLGSYVERDVLPAPPRGARPVRAGHRVADVRQ